MILHLAIVSCNYFLGYPVLYDLGTSMLGFLSARFMDRDHGRACGSMWALVMAVWRFSRSERAGSALSNPGMQKQGCRGGTWDLNKAEEKDIQRTYVIQY